MATDYTTIEDMLPIAQEHIKSDTEDSTLIQYLKAALVIAEGFCRRRLYFTQATKDSDVSGVAETIAAAKAAWTSAQVTYEDDCEMLLLNQRAYFTARAAASRIFDGIIIDDAIIAAILLLTGHLDKNKQEVVAGQYGQAIQIPMGAQRILEPYMAV